MKYSIILLILFFAQCVEAQRLIDRNGRVSFFSEAPIENIEAVTNQALAVLDTSKNQVAVSILMKGFQFDKALMQEHFNENYVESDKYPKATFSGELNSPVQYDKPGKYQVQSSGKMTLHGVTKMITAEVELNITQSTITATTTFPIRVADYKIKIPSVVIDNIAEVVEVKAKFTFEK